MKDFQKFYNFTKEYTDYFEIVRNSEEEKYKALCSRDPKRMDSIFNIMVEVQEKLGTLETARIALNKELGLGEKTLKEIIETENLSVEEKTKTTDLYNRLKIAAEQARHFNKRSLEYAQMNIDIVNKINGVFTEATGYSAGGAVIDNTTKVSILDTKA